MKKLIIFILLFPLFAAPAYADDMYSGAAAAFGTEAMENALSDDEIKITGHIKIGADSGLEASAERIWRNLIDAICAEINANLKFASGLFALAVGLSAGECVCGDKAAKKYIEICACACAAAMMVGDMDSIVMQTSKAMNRISDYSKAAMPVLFTAAAASGRAGSAAAKYAAVSLAVDVLISAAQKIIIPLIYAYIALITANSLFSNSLLAYLSKMCKWLCTTIMTALTIAFSSYIGLTGLVSGTVDAAALRVAKTVISSALPVIGGILSDASAAVLSAAGIVRNSAGIFGLISVCVMCSGPFAVLLVKYMLLNFVSAVSGMMPNNAYSKLLSETASAVGMLIGLLGCCAIMMFVSVSAGIKVVTI